MATVKAYVRSSKKNNIVNVRFRLSTPGAKLLYYVSDLQINVDLFDNKREEIKSRALYPDKERRIFNEKVNELKSLILRAWEERGDDYQPTSEWLRNAMQRRVNGETPVNDDFFDIFDKFLTYKQYDEKREEHYDVLKRIMIRYENYEIFNGGKFRWSLEISAFDLSNFEDYLKNEYRLAELYPSLYEGVKKLSPRGRNTIANMMTKLRVFYLWAVRMGETTTNPFANYSIKEQIYGRPYFLTLEERDRVYNFPMPNNPFLAIQRDIFVFQCMIGCRVSDLYRLTRENINDGAIEYVPTKTKGDNQEYARVPLTKKAIEILEKYKEYGGRTLFPFISEQKYNDSIKKILKMAGIDRKVTVINPVTQKEEQKPIYEIASSHLARRTFIGNIYKKVKDPNIIGSMSGHVEGSKAFARYRDIDDEIKLDVLKEIE